MPLDQTSYDELPYTCLCPTGSFGNYGDPIWHGTAAGSRDYTALPNLLNDWEKPGKFRLDVNSQMGELLHEALRQMAEAALLVA